MAKARTYLVHLRTDGDGGNGCDTVTFKFGTYAQAKYHMDIMAVTGDNIWSLCIEHPCGKLEEDKSGYTRCAANDWQYDEVNSSDPAMYGLDSRDEWEVENARIHGED